MVRRTPIKRTLWRSILVWTLFGVFSVSITSGFLYSILLNENLMLGILILCYFISQLVLAIMNMRACRKCLMGDESITWKKWITHNYWETRGATYFHQHPTRVGILLVGYREDPIYWEQCVRSIRTHSPPSIVRVVCAAIDGNERPDTMMEEQFYETWDKNQDNTQPEDGYTNISLESPIDRVSLLLPHRGKRHTMRSGFEYLRIHYPDLDYIIVMDSDSVVTPNSIWSLVRVMDENPANGCGTGCLQILNLENMLARIIDARYAYAFNIERSAMSALGVMNCCSGPFSIYRTSCLTDGLLQDFIAQRFCMQPVGPGDDRHLTNLILAQGYRSIQCPYSLAKTECPLSIRRFFIQQLRWMRSFYREQPFQIYAMPVQNVYLIVVTVYEILFPFVMTLSLIPTFGILYPSPVIVFYHRLLLCISVIVLRTLILIFTMRRIDLWYNVFMLPLFFIALLPMKLYAILTMGIQNWMTSNRLFLRHNCNIDVFCMWWSIFLWNALYVLLLDHRFGWFSMIS